MARCNRKQLAAGLWRRAEQEGARTETERRNYGIADDVYAAGLLLAFMAFIPFCEPGSIDAPSLQRCGRLSPRAVLCISLDLKAFNEVDRTCKAGMLEDHPLGCMRCKAECLKALLARS